MIRPLPDIKELVNLYNNGMSCVDLTHLFRCSLSGIYAKLQREGFCYRPIIKKQPHYNGAFVIPPQRILNHWLKSGWTQKRINAKIAELRKDSAVNIHVRHLYFRDFHKHLGE